jgi:hypothetical protein
LERLEPSAIRAMAILPVWIYWFQDKQKMTK